MIFFYFLHILYRMSNECPICISPYNKSNRLPICCPDANCQYTACRDCIKQYILTDNSDPKCMDCSKSFPRTFLQSMMTHSWLTKEFKQSRKVTLTERQKAMIPETMPYIEQKKKTDVYLAQINNHALTIRQKQQEIVALREEQAALCELINRIRNGESIISEKEKKQHTIKCPECPAFLNNDYICPSCNTRICKHCRDIIPINAKIIKPSEGSKASEGSGSDQNMKLTTRAKPDKQEIHECNPDTLKTAQMLKQDTKPCPKCGTQIFKISGCDQMWDPQCGTAFSWKTGKIVTGVIHNPHYFQFMNQNGGMPRQPGDVVCGGLPSILTINRILVWIPPHQSLQKMQELVLQNKLNELTFARTEQAGHKIIETINNRIIFSHVIRVVGHINDVEIPKYRLDMSEASTRMIRIEYIEQKITEEDFGKLLFEKERQVEKSTEILHVLETFVNVTTDILQSMVQELSPLIEHRNDPAYKKQFVSVGGLFGFKEPIYVDSRTDKFMNKTMEKISCWWQYNDLYDRMFSSINSDGSTRPAINAMYGEDGWHYQYPEDVMVLRPKMILKYYKELSALEKYCNEEFEKISKAYKLVAPYIDINQNMITNKKY